MVEVGCSILFFDSKHLFEIINYEEILFEALRQSLNVLECSIAYPIINLVKSLPYQIQSN